MDELKKYRLALLLIGCQHPAENFSNPNDALVRIFNDITASAREAVGAVGETDDQKADWCSRQVETRNFVGLTQLLADYADQGVSVQSGLRDLLTDLRHCCADKQLDFEKAVSSSAEVYEEDDDDWAFRFLSERRQQPDTH